MTILEVAALPVPDKFELIEATETKDAYLLVI